MAKRNELLTKAEQIASLIFECLHGLRHKPMEELSLCATLQVIKLQSDIKEGKDYDFDKISPRIFEIILFGPVAEGEENSNGIKLILFDNGHFSDFFPCMPSEHHMGGWHEGLGENFQWLMNGWFEISDEQVQQMLGDVEVDLHVLPACFFKSKDAREEIVKNHQGSNFFKNAFGSAMRFNRATKKFEPLTSKHLEKKFSCKLSDLQ